MHNDNSQFQSSTTSTFVQVFNESVFFVVLFFKLSDTNVRNWFYFCCMNGILYTHMYFISAMILFPIDLLHFHKNTIKVLAYLVNVFVSLY